MADSLWDRVSKKMQGLNPFAVASDAAKGEDIEHTALVKALGTRKPEPSGPKPPAPKMAPKQDGAMTPEEREVYERQQRYLRGR